MYGLLGYLSWIAIQRWPDGPDAFILPALDIPIQQYYQAIVEKIRAASKP